jgi:hypothetical protein
VSRRELLGLVDERREEVRAFLDWADAAENSGWSLRMRNRPDIRHAAEAAALFPEPWWGLVVFTCFGSVKGARTVSEAFAEPLPADDAAAVLASLRFERGSVGHHRIQPAVKGAKHALVAACDRHELFHDVMHSDDGFEGRYARLLGADAPQWKRTTAFDLLLRAGALGIGGRQYEPEFAYLAGSTGPKAGFKKIWGREITPSNAAWGEALLRAWTEEWDDEAKRVGGSWTGDPYRPADFENALCIWHERRRSREDS